MKLKRLTAMVLALCLCASLLPGVAAADTPKVNKITMAAMASGNEAGGYEVDYVAQLTMSEEFAKIVALNKERTDFLKTLRFTCILKDDLVKQLTSVSTEDFVFTGGGSANFQFLSVSKGASDEIHIVYKLNEAKVDAWKDPLVELETVKNALMQSMTMTGVKFITAAQLNTALGSDGAMTTQGWVKITYPDGGDNLIPFFDVTEMEAAYGSTQLVVKEEGGSTGGGSTGGGAGDGGGGSAGGGSAGGDATGGGSDVTEPEESVTIADPNKTGVSNLLNTDEHIVFMVGDDQGNFRPEAAVTRAEVAQIFYALLRNKDVKFTTLFTDVPENAWYAKAVHTLAALGMVSGVGDGKYDPNRPITRAEFAAIAAQFAQKAESGFDFTDVPRTHWAYIGVSTAAAYGWVSGVGNNQFAPNRSIKRVEAATIVNHMLGRLGDKAKTDAGLGRQFPDVHKSHWGWYEIAEAATAHDHTFNDTRTQETWELT